MGRPCAPDCDCSVCHDYLVHRDRDFSHTVGDARKRQLATDEQYERPDDWPDDS